jgi:DNA-binding MarR family transcriptional regulator
MTKTFMKKILDTPRKASPASRENPGTIEPADRDTPSEARDISPVILVQCLEETLHPLPNDTPLHRHPDSYSLRILMALRHIMHFVDSYSRQLATEYKITGPQLICLYSIVKNGPLTLSELGKLVSLSMSTANGIVDRLEQKKLVQRERKDHDRRKVIITATDEGEKLSSEAPLPLQGRLIKAIRELPELEQVSIALSLERVLNMMKEDG